jgi:hypothetical protein
VLERWGSPSPGGREVFLGVVVWEGRWRKRVSKGGGAKHITMIRIINIVREPLREFRHIEVYYGILCGAAGGRGRSL